MTRDAEPHVELREELDDLFALVYNLPGDDTIRVKAKRVRRICDLFAQVMDDAVELTEHNRSLANAVKVGDKLISRLSGLKPEEPLL